MSRVRVLSADAAAEARADLRAVVEVDPVSQDPARLRKAYGCFPSGVTALCALVDGTPVGMAASSFTSVSLSPALVSVCIQTTSSTWPMLRDSARLGVSVLGEGHEGACRSLATKGGDRFADVPWDVTSGGAVFVREAPVWLECSLHDEVVAGDHFIALLEIHGATTNPDTPPLVFHGSRFRKLAPGMRHLSVEELSGWLMS